MMPKTLARGTPTVVSWNVTVGDRAVRSPVNLNALGVIRMKILVVDVGGTNVKILGTGRETRRKCDASFMFTSDERVTVVLALAANGVYDVDYIGKRGLLRVGKKKWRKYVNDAVARLSAALLPDYIVIGGGNARKLKELPPHCRVGDNSNAFRGGFRMWEDSQTQVSSSPQVLSGK